MNRYSKCAQCGLGQGQRGQPSCLPSAQGDEPSFEEVIELLVDGTQVPMKPYVQATLTGVILGFIRHLKMVEGGKVIELRIELPEGLTSPASERRKA